MIGMKLKQATSQFFDRKTVVSAMDRAKRKVLSRFGAFVRRRARSSIRKRKKVSEPGTPPTNRTGLLRNNIFFVYDRPRDSVVIGPILLNRGGEAPELLEHGGQVTRRVRGKRVRMTYRPRPFMGPAMEKETPQLPRLWRDSLR